MRRVALLLAALSVPALAVAQVRDAALQQSPPAGAIAGTVTASLTGQPLPGATVQLVGRGSGGSHMARTDAAGGFVFEGLAAAEYVLSATRQGFIEVTYGQREPGSGRPGTPVVLLADQRLEEIDLTMPRGGVITGRVIDEFNYPATDTQVRAYRLVWQNGQRSMRQAKIIQTDDRGVYRLYGLVPGEYLVVATPRAATAMDEAVMRIQMQAVELELMAQQAAARGRMAEVEAELVDAKKAMEMRKADVKPVVDGYTPIYYPGTLSPGMATRVSVGPSEEKAGIDIGLQVVPLASVEGFVTGLSPMPRSTVYLVEQGPLGGLNTKSVRVSTDGRFAFSNVPPGDYELWTRVRPPAPAPNVSAGQSRAAIEVAVEAAEASQPEALWASQPLRVTGQPLVGIVLTLQSGVAVSGFVEFVGDAAPEPLNRARLNFIRVGQSASAAEKEIGTVSATVESDGRFTAKGLAPGQYTVSASGPVLRGWTLDSVEAQGREVLDLPLDLRQGDDVSGLVATFSTGSTILGGMLQDPAGGPAPDFTVVVFAEDDRFWTPTTRRVTATRPSSSGRYQVTGLPPGSYRIAAVTDVEPGQWLDPEFLRQLVPASVAMTLPQGGSVMQDLQVQR